MSPSKPADPSIRPAIHRTVWILGLVSLLTDLSSEYVHGLLPVYLAGTLGASALAIGLIEGAAEGVALAVKVFSGWISDVIGRRKPLVLLGYALAALTKPLFPMASGVGLVVTARLLDRVGKGIRGAPRDAMVADVTPKESRGAAYGLRQSLDTVGAVLGPLAAIGAMLALAGNLRLALWLAFIPGVFAVALIVFGVRETASGRGVSPRAPFSREGLSQLGTPYFALLALGAAMAFARSTEAFLVLRASSLGVADTYVPAVLVVMALAYTFSAYPAGRLADRIAPWQLLFAGMLVLALADLVIALAPNVATLGVGLLLWGLHMGLTQGVLAAMIGTQAPGALRGSAFGLFNLASGLAILAGSATSGWLWDRFSPVMSFGFGAGAALVVALLVPVLGRMGGARAA